MEFFFFWWESSFFPIQSKKTEKIDKSSKPSAARCDWMKAGRDLNPPITERLNKPEFFFFFKEKSYEKQGTFGSSRVEFAQQEVKGFFFSFKINIKKGQNFKQIYFLCQPNSIPRRFILFYF